VLASSPAGARVSLGFSEFVSFTWLLRVSVPVLAGSGELDTTAQRGTYSD
jgi:hypothetical protein